MVSRWYFVAARLLPFVCFTLFVQLLVNDAAAGVLDMVMVVVHLVKEDSVTHYIHVT